MLEDSVSDQGLTGFPNNGENLRPKIQSVSDQGLTGFPNLLAS